MDPWSPARGAGEGEAEKVFERITAKYSPNLVKDIRQTKEGEWMPIGILPKKSMPVHFLFKLVKTKDHRSSWNNQRIHCPEGNINSNYSISENMEVRRKWHNISQMLEKRTISSVFCVKGKSRHSQRKKMKRIGCQQRIAKEIFLWWS